MMRMTQGWTRLRTAVVALGLLACTSTGAKADQMVSNLLDYSTAGSVLTDTGVTGKNVISYVPITNASIDPTSNLPLGSFQVAALPAGQTTTYANTPFSITFSPLSYNNVTLPSTTTPVTLTGTLNGQIRGSYQSSVKVEFNPITDGAFPLAGASSTLNMLQNDQKLLVPAAVGGTTTLEGMITTNGTPGEVPAPEPSTIALFLSTIGGLGLRRIVLKRRQRSQA
jgi:hypothetical protein